MRKIAPRLFTPRLAASNGSAPGSLPPGADLTSRFRQLVLPHLDGAYNLACYLTRDPVLSEDIVQDAIIRAFRAFEQFRGASPRAWLFAIVRNCCWTAQSAQKGILSLIVQESGISDETGTMLGDQADPSPTPEEEVIRKAEINRLTSAIEAMPEPFREAIVLRDIEDMSYAEIAEVTGVPIGTVMSRLSRGRSILAKELLPSASERTNQGSASK
ncbi:MAG TPA: sigma-70 family RNA polymerase sigma factor [Sphingomicrobium sp.]|nr:sigma-70 family RNA polymerase sigma factor [Sphingomicrobium sp.]